jgi:glycosyltransferase EpsD
MPYNIMEAMMCGKPVIASNNRGHGELIHHFRNGLFFDAESDDTLGRYLGQFIDDSALMVIFGVAGRRSVEPYLNRNVWKELKDIYDV